MVKATLFFFAFVSLQTCIFAQEPVSRKLINAVTALNVDPISTAPCKSLPTDAPQFTSIDGELLESFWWEYVKKATKVSDTSRTKTCRRLTQLQEDRRLFYWQISCPYKVYSLSKFTRVIPKTKSLTETCYLLYPCKENIRIVNCETPYCNIRCRTPHPNIRNSVCLENNFVVHKKVHVFCTYTYKKVRKDWIKVDCMKDPRFCFKKITIRAPQTCECWSCWDMRVTMPDKKFPDVSKG